ncbi:MAG: peptidylprolyl isomerase [Clostridia bacterium]|nr:peptidylprolyl isomerase [Clostridia bacterium]
MVTITIKDFGDIKLELDRENAPITVDNFEKLAKEGFYNGLTFHRIYKGFMIQGGCPLGNGTGGSDNTIKGEFLSNGVPNKISHTRGTISMARSQSPNSASSQFFICDADATFLDGQYAAFGKVTEGLDVLDAVASVDVLPNPYSGEVSSPVTQPVIEKIIVE